jgi:hypothetical protein
MAKDGYGLATLGNMTFRLNPDQVSYSYEIDYSTIDTIGGQVHQILGATTGDLTVSGSFGQDRNGDRSSWRMAEQFQVRIRQMMDQQTLFKQGKGNGQPTHNPIRFTFFDGTHNWDFKVLIKSIADTDGGGSVQHSTGKFAYKYTLTLFIVEESSLDLKKITTDKFIARLSAGMGWKRNKFNGSNTIADAIDFIQKNGGTFDDYYLGLLEGTGTGSGQGKFNTPTKPTNNHGGKRAI